MNADQSQRIEKLFADLPDFRDQIPQSIRIRPGEKVVHFEHCPQPKLDKSVDRDAALAKIFRVSRVDLIGTNGPAVAAVPIDSGDMSAHHNLFVEGEFTRDNTIGALFMADSHPATLESAIFGSLPHLGVGYNEATHERPGEPHHEYWPMGNKFADKILLETGWPSFPTYMAADVGSLLLQCIALRCVEDLKFLDRTYTAKDGENRTVLYAVDEMVRCLEGHLIDNPWGFLMYRKEHPRAHINRTMPDSHDSMFDRSGRFPNFDNGVAASHDQGFAYDALVGIANLYHQLGRNADAARLLAHAEKLRASFLANMWVEDERGGYFAAGVTVMQDGELTKLDVRKAISFFVLNSGILDVSNADHRVIVEKAIRTMFSSDMLAAGGLRSCAIGEDRYREGAYHNGNVWLFKNVWVAIGLRKWRYHALALDLEERTMRAIDETCMFPEFVNGGTDPEIKLNDMIIKIVSIDDWKFMVDYGLASADKPFENMVMQPAQQIQFFTSAASVSVETYWDKHGKLPQGHVMKSLEEEIKRSIAT